MGFISLSPGNDLQLKTIFNFLVATRSIHSNYPALILFQSFLYPKSHRTKSGQLIFLRNNFEISKTNLSL